jgi:hypothetical protein
MPKSRSNKSRRARESSDGESSLSSVQPPVVAENVSSPPVVVEALPSSGGGGGGAGGEANVGADVSPPVPLEFGLGEDAASSISGNSYTDEVSWSEPMQASFVALKKVFPTESFLPLLDKIPSDLAPSVPPVAVDPSILAQITKASSFTPSISEVSAAVPGLNGTSFNVSHLVPILSYFDKHTAAGTGAQMILLTTAGVHAASGKLAQNAFDFARDPVDAAVSTAFAMFPDDTRAGRVSAAALQRRTRTSHPLEVFSSIKHLADQVPPVVGHGFRLRRSARDHPVLLLRHVSTFNQAAASQLMKANLVPASVLRMLQLTSEHHSGS